MIQVSVGCTLVTSEGHNEHKKYYLAIKRSTIQLIIRMTVLASGLPECIVVRVLGVINAAGLALWMGLRWR
jgi:hypothetical protein